MRQHQHPTGARWGRRAGVIVLAAVVLVAALVLLIGQPIKNPAPTTKALPSGSYREPTTPPQSSTSAPGPSASATTTTASSARTCRQGVPVTFFWPDMGLKNVTIEPTGLKQNGALAEPVSKHTIGWYSLGRQPGAGLGNIIIQGHTYHDGSAVFREDFTAKLKRGSKFWFVMDNGSTCTYQVTDIYPLLFKALPVPKGAMLWADAVEKYHFYDLDGKEQVLGATCSGDLKPGSTSHEALTAWKAKPLD